jgi:hypothetical protein
MSILLNEKTPVLVQGFTGTIGSFHAQEMLDYGTNVVGGVTPGKGGTTHLGKPVFDSLKIPAHAPDRPKLRRGDQSRPGHDGDHAGPYLRARPGRHRRPLGHAWL